MKTIDYEEWIQGAPAARKRSLKLLALFDLKQLKRRKRARPRNRSERRPR